jgi:hypothetical protein
MELWRANRDRCYETITNKINPALQKLEEENDRAFARFRRVGEIWNARKLRFPEQILAWTRE